MKNLVLIKLGGSLITNKGKPFSVRIKTIRRLCREIHEVRSIKENVYIVGNGQGSFAHIPAHKYKTHEGIINENSLRGIAEVQDAAARINRIVIGEFIKAKVDAVSLNPSSFIITQEGRVKNSFLSPLKFCLNLGLVPVVYGDVIFDEEKGCSILSTDQILSYLALRSRKNYKSIKIVYCGNTDGVYGADGKTIPKITKKSFNNVRKSISDSKWIDVTGGMLHKVEESLKVADKGINTLIINGLVVNELRRAILGKKINATYIVKG